MGQFYFLISILLLSIAFIIFGSSKLKINPFFILLIASLGVGFAAGLPPEKIISAIKSGVGHTMEAIGLLIIIGTTLGVVLDKSGATISMANFILSRVGVNRAPLAISLTGFIIGLPIFCDSGFVVLSGLSNSLARRTNTSNIIMASCLATSLYAVHCLVPPHPGAAAAAGIVGVDLGKLMIMGIALAIPTAIAGYIWSNCMGRLYKEEIEDDPQKMNEEESLNLPSPVRSFLPILIPLLLISLKTILFLFENLNEKLLKAINFLGEPVIALLIGLAFSIELVPRTNRKLINGLLNEAIEKAGPVLVIIAAGGAFGAILKAVEIGKYLEMALSGYGLGLFLPFIITVFLKTALGSSTVAIITAASIMSPMLGGLRLDSEWGRVLTILAMGAGSMMVSHANDAYFWVISRFSGISTDLTLKVYSTATIIMGITAMFFIFILSLFLL